MQKFLISIVLLCLLGGCGSGSGSSDSTKNQEEAELKAADSIVTELQKTQDDLSGSMKETLQEVDSLLENI